MKVKDLLTRDVERVPPDLSIREAAAKMRQLDVGALPVYDGDRLIGMVTDRDIVVRAVADAKDPQECTVSDVMSPGIVYCFEDQKIEEAADLMREKQIRRLIVLNRDKRLVGIVSLGDLAVEGSNRVAGKTLEAVSQPTHH